MGRTALTLACACAAAAALLAGCGAGSGPYTAEATSPCLRELGYRVAPATDLIAGTAANGGLVARGFGNTLTIGFGADARDALRLERAYRRLGGGRGVRTTKRNAVLVWTISPTLAQMQAAEKCLKS